MLIIPGRTKQGGSFLGQAPAFAFCWVWDLHNPAQPSNPGPRLRVPGEAVDMGLVLYGTAHVWGGTCPAREASDNKRKKNKIKQLDHTNTGTKSHSRHFPLLLQSPAFKPQLSFPRAPFVSNPMAQQPWLERQLKSPTGETRSEERAPFSASQKGRKHTCPPTSCSPAPAALEVAGDTCRSQMLGSRPAPRGR